MDDARLRRRRLALAVLLAALMGGPAAHAQVDTTPDYVPEDEITLEAPEAVGWDFFLRLGVGTSLANSKRVIGATDGNTWTVGVDLHLGWDFIEGPHEWRNDISVTEAFARTPQIDEWVKSADQLDFISAYFYHLPRHPWFGPFGRFRLRAAMFKGLDVQAADQTYLVTRSDDTVDTIVGRRLLLTDPFNPLRLRETVGVFAKPETRPEAELRVLLGFGSRQVFADGQLAISDDDATAEIEVITLESFIQAGAELIFNFWGQLDEGRVAYTFDAEVMTPFVNDLASDDDRSAFELTNIEVASSVQIQVFDWLAISYRFSAIKEPQLLDDFQITNLLLLNLAHTFDERAADAAE